MGVTEHVQRPQAAPVPLTAFKAISPVKRQLLGNEMQLLNDISCLLNLERTRERENERERTRERTREDATKRGREKDSERERELDRQTERAGRLQHHQLHRGDEHLKAEIGRASCRERV